jgi:hypothetical protein
MAHVHFPFQFEEVSFLVTTMVYGSQFPARPNGREKKKNRLPLPTINITEHFLQVHLTITF